MDCTKYNINVETLFLSLVPPSWLTDYETDLEKEIWVAYLRSVASGLDNYQTVLYSKCLELKTFLTPTGQHLSLVEYLNDLYDAILRRITITENDIPAVAEIWYLQGETDPQPKSWYEQGEVDPVPKTWYLRIETDVKQHFTINIPVSITYVEEVLRGQVNPYVVNGYNYNIVTF